MKVRRFKETYYFLPHFPRISQRELKVERLRERGITPVIVNLTKRIESYNVDMGLP